MNTHSLPKQVSRAVFLRKLKTQASRVLKRLAVEGERRYREFDVDELEVILMIADELSLPKRNSKPSVEGIAT